MASVDEFAIPQVILRHFDLASSPYTEIVSARINTRRRAYPEQKLFYDHLLAFAGIDGCNVYPPDSPASLRRLLHAIYTSDIDRLKQDCFFYYLLRDYDAVGAQTNGHAGMEVDGDLSHTDRAGYFATKRCLPKAWRIFMDGYWSLDNGHWEASVISLTDPSISSINFVPQILQVLASHVSPPTLSTTLIHTFLQQTQQTLSTPLENDIKLLSLASTSSISSAFTFIRSQTPEHQPKLRESLWCWALGIPKTPCGKGDHCIQAKALKEMLHLPLQPDENAHLIHFLSHPPRNLPQPALSLLHDLVTLRLIHQGQYAESLQLDKDLAGRQNGGQRRREMVREFIGILPEAQRRVLLADGEAVASRRNEERRKLVNGFGNEEVEMIEERVDPFKPAILADLARGVPLPESPVVRTTASPFAGPPRFASPGPMNRQLGNRVLSGSPFTLPRLVSNGSPTPNPPRPIINDDDDPVPIGTRRRTRARRSQTSITLESAHEASETGDAIEEPVESTTPGRHHTPVDGPTAAEPTPAPRRSGRVVSGSQSSKQGTEATPPSPPSKNTRSRQSSAQPNPPIHTMPGGFEKAPLFTDIPEDTEVSGDRPRLPSTVPESRARTRRSASRAVLDDPPAPAPKRVKRAPSQATDDGTEKGVRRSTRRGTAQPSERGSPTPSVAASVVSTIGGRSEGGRRSRRAESQTPRMSTRAKRG